MWSPIRASVIPLALLILEASAFARQGGAPLEVGVSPPPLPSGPWLNSDPLGLEDLRGRVTVVLFWGSYYEDFQPFLADLKSLAGELSEQGVVFLGISSEPFKQLEENAKKLGVAFPLVLDATTATFRAFRVDRIPYCYVIDGQGKIAWSGPPYDANGFGDTLRGIAMHPRNKAAWKLRKAVDQARALETQSDRAKAVSAWLEAQKAGKGDPAIDAQIRSALERLEEEAAAEARAARDQVTAGAYLDGVAALEGVAKKFAGTRTAASVRDEARRYREAPRFSKEREARSLMEKARAALDRNDLAQAAEYLLQIEARMDGTQAASDGAAALAALRADAAQWWAIERTLQEREIKSLRNLADSAKRAGKPDLAKDYLARADALQAKLAEAEARNAAAAKKPDGNN